MVQRLSIVPQVRHLLSMTLPAQRRGAAAMLAFIQEARPPAAVAAPGQLVNQVGSRSVSR
jgi:hypothetical protein